MFINMLTRTFIILRIFVTAIAINSTLNASDTHSNHQNSLETTSIALFMCILLFGAVGCTVNRKH